jgi:hypothetical protein
MVRWLAGSVGMAGRPFTVSVALALVVAPMRFANYVFQMVIVVGWWRSAAAATAGRNRW